MDKPTLRGDPTNVAWKLDRALWRVLQCLMDMWDKLPDCEAKNRNIRHAMMMSAITLLDHGFDGPGMENPRRELADFIDPR